MRGELPRETPVGPIVDRPHVVLVGAGTAHLAVLFGRKMGRWLRGTTTTLVHPRSTVLYSGRLPAYLAGECGEEDVTIDLVSLCARAGVRFVEGEAEQLNFEERSVRVRGRPVPLRYDALALTPGTITAGEPGDAVPVRRLESFVDNVRRWEEAGKKTLAVVGGGASGAELAVALAARGFRPTIFERGPRLLPEFSASVARRFAERLRVASVVVRLETPVRTFVDGRLRLADGTEAPFDAALWATGADAAPWLRAHRPALPVDGKGFLRVTTELRVVGQERVFATGDGTSVEGRRYPRNGVVAVHQGRHLGTSIDGLFQGRPPKPFRLERPTLWILNGGGGRAVAGFGPLSFTGKIARRWKESLDRKWMAPAARPLPVASDMLCEGCGGKAPARTLEAALKPTFEDVGVWQTERGWSAGSIDALTSWTDDGVRFGEIATLHALSDVYAKGLKPRSVLVAVTLPRASPRDTARMLEEVDGGVRAALEGTGATLASGHTALGERLAIAIAVTAEPVPTKPLWGKDRLRAGDALVLTKPLGTGIAMAARAQGACAASTWRLVEASMRTSNAHAAEVGRKAGVVAATDVTGFGLAVAAAEMAKMSAVRLRWAETFPTFPGVSALYTSPLRPSLWDENRKRAEALGAPPLEPVAYDPQTSGGLLLAVTPEIAPSLGIVVASVL